MLSFTHHYAGYLLSPLCVVTWLACLVRHWRTIREAEIIVQADRPHAFGTTLNMIELARRLHPCKRILVLVFWEPKNHNPKLDLIFGELITFVTWKRPCVRFKLFNRPVIMPPRPLHDGIAHRMSLWWFGRFARHDMVLYDKPSLYRRLPRDEEALRVMPWTANGEPEIIGHTANALLSRYFNAVPAPVYALPVEIEAAVDAEVLIATGGTSPLAGWCGMHLKKDEGDDTFKDGSPIEAYLPAMRKIVDAGYQILLKGDRDLPDAYRKELGGMIVDAKSLKVDPNIFNLYVIVKSTIFIGDSGPGSWMIGGTDVPSLAMNVFPIGLGFSITWVYFKSCFDAADRKASVETLFSEIAELGNRPANWFEKTMTTEEIEETVEEFLRQPVPRTELDDHPEIVSLLPAWSCFRSVGVSRLSPAWVRNNCSENIDRSANKCATAES